MTIMLLAEKKEKKIAHIVMIAHIIRFTDYIKVSVILMLDTFQASICSGSCSTDAHRDSSCPHQADAHITGTARSAGLPARGDLTGPSSHGTGPTTGPGCT